MYMVQITEEFLVQRNFICILQYVSFAQYNPEITPIKTFHMDLRHQLIC